MVKVCLILLLLVLSLFLANPIAAQSGLIMPNKMIVVTIQTDTVNGTDGECSLREAVISANTDTASGSVGGECDAGSGVDTIIIPVGRHLLQIAGANEHFATTGNLDIRESVNIYGAGKYLAIIDSNIADRIFHVPPISVISPCAWQILPSPRALSIKWTMAAGQ
jgi:CSLREA domain-containing protein